MIKEPSRKSQLSPPRRRLLEVLQTVNFGRIKGLRLRKGEPLFDPAPALVRDVKLGGENNPRPELGLSDFDLRQEHLDLFRQCDQLGDGVIDELEFRFGLPVRLLITQPVGNLSG